MKILVCISHVPDTTSKINFIENNSKFDKNGIQFVINPNDEFGLTRAMWFKEKLGASVDVINVGLADTEPTLRKALAIGADKAIRINSDPKNGLNVAKQIAHIVSSESYDLIIGGRESIDYNGGMVPGMIAGLTDYNFVDKCISLEINNDSITAAREIEGGNLFIAYRGTNHNGLDYIDEAIKSGAAAIAIDELESFKDLLILTIFFISMIFFINHLTRLMRKLIGFFSL